jgi:hypothetical protein
VDVELARQQWQSGDRRVESMRGDGKSYASAVGHVELIVDELRKRVGQTFTLGELANAYVGADAWAREVFELAEPDAPPPVDGSISTDAAFHRYARGATDYTP